MSVPTGSINIKADWLRDALDALREEHPYLNDVMKARVNDGPSGLPTIDIMVDAKWRPLINDFLQQYMDERTAKDTPTAE